MAPENGSVANPDGTPSGDGAAGGEFIAGTTFKTPEDLAKGYLELKALNDRQGNELGTIRKDHDALKSQTETLANLLKENLTSKSSQAQSAQPAVDYAAELTKVEEQIQGLDPVAEGYQKSLATLVAKSNKLAALQQHEKTLGAAGEMLKRELGERDIKAAQDAFYRENPTFNTPEMQAKIRAYIAKDTTGMSDPLAAFREIQRDEAAAEAKRLTDENAEYKRLLALNKGKDDAGKVVVKGQQATPAPAQHTKVTGKDLDAGMKAALQGLNTA